MKTTYIRDLVVPDRLGEPVSFPGWVRARRDHGRVVFLDVCDSTGSVQVVVDADECSSGALKLAKGLAVDSAIAVEGLVAAGNQAAETEIRALSLCLIGGAEGVVAPSPRSDIDMLSPELADHLLKNRHLYIRNPQLMKILAFRHQVTGALHQWFRNDGFIEIHAPVLTPVPLYEDSTAVSAILRSGETVFLTQCVAFYLESAVHAFEKVYNIGPSFRGESSKSDRHLVEYWHVKAEVAFCDLEGIIGTVEAFVSSIVTDCAADCADISASLGLDSAVVQATAPFPRISYREALSIISKRGYPLDFGRSLTPSHETVLAEGFDGPFWVTHLPRSTEAFPYTVDPSDDELTLTADLIAPGAYGELLGVAQKIDNLPMLDERMAEKGRAGDSKYEWLRDLRYCGCVPHAGFGMGLERLLRWLLGVRHVRDTIPFPRIFDRTVYP